MTVPSEKTAKFLRPTSTPIILSSQLSIEGRTLSGRLISQVTEQNHCFQSLETVINLGIPSHFLCRIHLILPILGS
jgi:hypothetical protein